MIAAKKHLTVVFKIHLKKLWTYPLITLHHLCSVCTLPPHLSSFPPHIAPLEQERGVVAEAVRLCESLENNELKRMWGLFRWAAAAMDFLHCWFFFSFWTFHFGYFGNFTPHLYVSMSEAFLSFPLFGICPICLIGKHENPQIWRNKLYSSLH